MVLFFLGSITEILNFFFFYYILIKHFEYRYFCAVFPPPHILCVTVIYFTWAEFHVESWTDAAEPGINSFSFLSIVFGDGDVNIHNLLSYAQERKEVVMKQKWVILFCLKENWDDAG